MKKFLRLLLVPFLVYSSLANATLNEVDKAYVTTRNILSNPGFELGKTGWTASGGTFAIVVSGSNLLVGSNSVTWDSGATSQTLTSTAVTIPNGLKGRIGIGWCSFQTPSGTATHKIQAYDGTNVLSEGTIVSATAPVKSGVEFTFPTTGSLSLRVISVASDEPLIAVDECYLGLSDNLRNINYVGPWITWTPTGAFTTNTTYTGRYRQVGNTGEFVARASFSGAPNAVTNTFNLPANLTIDTNALVTTSTGQNSQTLGQSVLKNDDAAVELELLPGHVILSSSTAVSAGVFDPTSGATHYLRQVTATNPISIAASDFLEVKFTVPIVEWTGAISAFYPDTLANSWAGYHDTTCSWARTNTAYGDPTADASCALVQRSNQNFGTVSTSGSVLPAITFTPKRAGRYYVQVNFKYFGSSTNDQWGVRLWDGTTVIAETQGINNCTSTSCNATIAGIYVASSTSAVVLSLQTKVAAGSFTINASSTGSTNGIDWNIFQIDQSLPAPVLMAAVAARAHNSATAVSGTLATVSWTTEDFDTNSALASGVFTCPSAGKYEINTALALSGTFVLNNTTTLEIQKNGTAVANVTHYIAAAVTNDHAQLSDIVSCASGDTLRIQVANSGTTPAIVSSDTRNFLSIVKISD